VPYQPQEKYPPVPLNRRLRAPEPLCKDFLLLLEFESWIVQLVAELTGLPYNYKLVLKIALFVSVVVGVFFFFVVKGPAAEATDAPQPPGLLCNPVMKMISFSFFQLM
jgi:hypothetical protein